ncbi:CLUMA_CG017193, isoform A [Clunio marinus]|uniref:CLUMA_CG017193, isoform A n=1 Tax=Clunio marinus TaxID=568069 RepID=A0A1J1IVF7_9DIPT|nr:CLUMA_CG017193, isoform A [Clunio marinus]
MNQQIFPLIRNLSSKNVANNFVRVFRLNAPKCPIVTPNDAKRPWLSNKINKTHFLSHTSNFHQTIMQISVLNMKPEFKRSFRDVKEGIFYYKI